MHGPASYAGGSYKAPTWPRLPVIYVLDTVALMLKPVRRAIWRRYRDNALARWAVVGLRFHVLEDRAAEYPAFDPNYTNETEIAHLEAVMVRTYLRLMAMPAQYGGSIQAVATWLPRTDPAAVAMFKMGASFWLSSIFRQNYLLTHEIGHCLGLNHRPQDEPNRSIMNGQVGAWLRLDDHDIESLTSYYHL